MAGIMTWNILFVDDQESICKQVKEFFEDIKGDCNFSVTTLTDFSTTITELDNRNYDLLILDVRLGDIALESEGEVGVQTLEKLKEHRFIPVIYYTALPAKVKSIATPPIWVVQKDKGLAELESIVQIAIASNLPQVNRALLHHFEKIQREYMWGFISENWRNFDQNKDKISLAYFLIRRFALSLSNAGIHEMALELGDDGRGIFTENPVHPLRYYIIPPLNTSFCNGDICQNRENAKFFALLTPACDLISHNGKKPNAEYVVLVECNKLEEQTEFIKYKEDDKNLEDLKKLIRNNRKFLPDRFYFLPSSLSMPHLIIDFQKLSTIAITELANYMRIATLDSPFAEALLAKFNRYFGRIGTPDLNEEIIIHNL